VSNIDRVVKAPAQVGHEAKPIETFGGGFNAASPRSKSDPADDEVDVPCAAVMAFAAKAPPQACRRPLFRR